MKSPAVAVLSAFKSLTSPKVSVSATICAGQFTAVSVIPFLLRHAVLMPNDLF